MVWFIATFSIIMIRKRQKKNCVCWDYFTWVKFGDVKIRVFEIGTLMFKITFISFPSKGSQFRNEIILKFLKNFYNSFLPKIFDLYSRSH